MLQTATNCIAPISASPYKYARKAQWPQKKQKFEVPALS